VQKVYKAEHVGFALRTGCAAVDRGPRLQRLPMDSPVARRISVPWNLGGRPRTTPRTTPLTTAHVRDGQFSSPVRKLYASLTHGRGDNHYATVGLSAQSGPRVCTIQALFHQTAPIAPQNVTVKFSRAARGA
jgi:hypothetical protein